MTIFSADSLLKRCFLAVVRIEVERGDDEDHPDHLSAGTGFCYNASLVEHAAIPAIVTNWHVIKDATKITFYFHQRQDDDVAVLGAPGKLEWDNPFEGEFPLRPVRHPKEEIDLVAFPVLAFLNGLAQRAGRPYFWRGFNKNDNPNEELLADLDVAEDVYFVGFPDGLYDRTHKTPIIRSGTTATPVSLPWRGEPMFLVDAAVFPGSSGSPVFLLQQPPYRSKGMVVLSGRPRFAFLGILTEVMQSAFEAHSPQLEVSTFRHPIGLGIVQQWTTVDEVIDEMCRVHGIDRGDPGAPAPKVTEVRVRPDQDEPSS